MLGEPAKRTWIIKNTPVTTCDLALECAAERGVYLAEWLTGAVQLAAEEQRRAKIILPDERGTPDGTPESPIAEVTRLLAAMAEVARVSGVPVPRYARAAAFRLARDRVREVIGRLESGRAL